MSPAIMADLCTTISIRFFLSKPLQELASHHVGAAGSEFEVEIGVDQLQLHQHEAARANEPVDTGVKRYLGSRLR